MFKFFTPLIFLIIFVAKPLQGQEDEIIKMTNVIIEFSVSVRSVFKSIHDYHQEEMMDSTDYAQAAYLFNRRNNYYAHKLHLIELRLDSLTKLKRALLQARDTPQARTINKDIHRFKDYEKSYNNKIINLKKHSYPHFIRLLKTQYEALSNQGRLIQEMIEAALDYRQEFKTVHSLSARYQSVLIELEQDVQTKIKNRKAMVAKYQYSDEQTYRAKVLPTITSLREAQSKLRQFRHENQEFKRLNKIFQNLSKRMSKYQHQRASFPQKFKHITDLIHQYEGELAKLKK